MYPTPTPAPFKLGVLRKSHLFEDTQSHNLLLALGFLLTGLISHNLTCYILFMGFAAVWVAGIRLADEKTFYRLSGAMAVFTCCCICLIPVL